MSGCWCPACASDNDWKEDPMTKLTMFVESMPETTVTVGSEGDISIRDDGKVIRILTAEQARSLAHALDKSADHVDGKLMGDGV